MTTVQVQYAKALIKEISGTRANEGWDEIQQLLNADEYLAANGGGSTYGAANYYIAFLGTPATTGTFGIQFGGHHLACDSTYKDGVLTGATPAFRGVEPFATFTLNSTTNQPLRIGGRKQVCCIGHQLELSVAAGGSKSAMCAVDNHSFARRHQHFRESNRLVRLRQKYQDVRTGWHPGKQIAARIIRRARIRRNR
ncbi:DUF3500 domain-containing protein [Hymenobacter sp. HMF4947]|uniref:DUF3500 domain-containing protein n=2 Tax=Hymenobacter ginkgonis TaxID=2682976 RepID=A0A7K1TL55_9BACT|nr:DUF3500 domain-containing protein [Hymenobacter ginkgonis]